MTQSTMTDKHYIRKTISQLKREMSPSEIERRSALLAQQLFQTELYKSAHSIYGYIAINQEVRTIPILQRALQDNKTVAIPKILNNEMCFIIINDLDQLAPGYAHIPEPIANTPLANDPNALILTPGLAFDLQGHRIGYGGGFYDRFLTAEPNHPTVALCYDFQLMPNIKPDEFDIAVDSVLWV